MESIFPIIFINYSLRNIWAMTANYTHLMNFLLPLLYTNFGTEKASTTLNISSLKPKGKHYGVIEDWKPWKFRRKPNHVQKIWKVQNSRIHDIRSFCPFLIAIFHCFLHKWTRNHACVHWEKKLISKSMIGLKDGYIHTCMCIHLPEHLHQPPIILTPTEDRRLQCHLCHILDYREATPMCSH